MIYPVFVEILKNFVVFEGPDGSGTTTQLNILEALFHPIETSENNKPLDSFDFMVAEPALPYDPANPPYLPEFCKTFEPTDGIIGKTIRSALKNKGVLTPETIAYLFAADRNEHIYGPEGVAQRCKRGELVVSDRYLPSSLVYQGITCGDDLPARLNRDFPGPELLFYFDIESKTAQKRISTRQEKEIYETLDFQIEVRSRYKALLPSFSEQGVKVISIDASLPPMEIALMVWAHLEKLPIFKR